MNTTKDPSPFALLWNWAADYHSGFYSAVVLAVLGVACNMTAYFCIAAMIRLLLSGGGRRTKINGGNQDRGVSNSGGPVPAAKRLPRRGFGAHGKEAQSEGIHPEPHPAGAG